MGKTYKDNHFGGFKNGKSRRNQAKNDRDNRKGKGREAIGKFLTKLGELIKSVGLKLLGEKPPAVTPTVTVSPYSSLKKVSAGAIADAIVRHIEINYDQVNRDLTRSPAFRTDIERVIKEV